MNTDYDFSRVGKRMPYTAPDGLFEQMRENVMKTVANGSGAKPKRQARKLHIAASTIAAIAASAALLIALHATLAPADIEVADVETAFGQLSADDQAYLLEAYQNDIFLNDREEQTY